MQNKKSAQGFNNLSKDSGSRSRRRLSNPNIPNMDGITESSEGRLNQPMSEIDLDHTNIQPESELEESDYHIEYRPETDHELTYIQSSDRNSFDNNIRLMRDVESRSYSNISEHNTVNAPEDSQEMSCVELDFNNPEEEIEEPYEGPEWVIRGTSNSQQQKEANKYYNQKRGESSRIDRNTSVSGIVSTRQSRSFKSREDQRREGSAKSQHSVNQHWKL